MSAHTMAKQRILLIEDDEAFAQVLAFNLEEKLHCNVSIANDSFEAANLMSGHPFDLILTDWKLPEQTGFKALNQADRSLALDPTAPEEWFDHKTPVIVVTACDSSEIERERKLKNRFKFLGVVSKGQSLDGILNQVETIFGNFPASATA